MQRSPSSLKQRMAWSSSSSFRYLFRYSHEFASPVSAREVVQSQKPLAFMIPDDVRAFMMFVRIHLFPVPLCPCLLKTSDRWGRQCVHKILDQAVAAVHQYPETKCTVFTLHHWIQKQGPDEESRYLRVCSSPQNQVNGIIDNDQQERTVS